MFEKMKKKIKIIEFDDLIKKTITGSTNRSPFKSTMYHIIFTPVQDLYDCRLFIKKISELSSVLVRTSCCVGLVVSQDAICRQRRAK